MSSLLPAAVEVPTGHRLKFPKGKNWGWQEVCIKEKYGSHYPKM